MTDKRLTGRIARERIGPLTLQPISAEIIAGYRELDDLTGVVSDVLDHYGLVTAVPGSVLTATVPGARIVGRALTIENVLRDPPMTAASVGQRAAAGDNGLADIEAHNLAEPGDVLVVKGVQDVSSMGRISATIGKRQGELGAIVDGAVRDVEHSRAIGYPIWARGLSPATGKYRLETVAINRPVAIGAGTLGSVIVHPGDLVLADRVGVVFVPFLLAAEVLARARAAIAGERSRIAAIESNVPIPELPGVRRDR